MARINNGTNTPKSNPRPSTPKPAVNSSAAMHTFVAYVEDLPGVLNRVSSLFRRRAYNIHSLTVGRTHQDNISRMTIVMEADDDAARRVEANLYKLVNVLHVEDVTYQSAVMRDMALIRVGASGDLRAQALQVCEVFRARVVDVAADSMVIEATGSEEKLAGLIEVLKPFGILEMVRTGSIAMIRGIQPTVTERRSVPLTSEVLSQPPLELFRPTDAAGNMGDSYD